MEEKYHLKDMSIGGGHTDLAMERRRIDTECSGIQYRREYGRIGYWERIRVTNSEGEESIGRPVGIYDSLCVGRMDRLDEDEIEDCIEEVARTLCRICDEEDICPERILVVGLGNRNLTPDSLGTESTERVKPTMQIKKEDEMLFYSLECSEISVLRCDVLAKSGIDAQEHVKAVCTKVSPDMVIVIDSLASRSADRLGTTLQISSTGICPGSGIGASRGRIDQSTLGVPVIAIGMPTVINSRMLVRAKDEVRAPRPDENLMVCPVAINEIVVGASRIIAGGINQAFGLDC